MARFGDAVDGTLLLPKQACKRAAVTSEHAALLAGVPWAAVQVYEPSRPVVLLAASVLCGGRVRVRVQPSAFMKLGVHAA